MAIVNKMELCNYLQVIYFKKYNKNISPIKIQKAMYFLLAFWGEKIQKAQNTTTELENPDGYDIELFKSDFQAWPYGPVDKDIYNKYKNDKSFDIEKALEFRGKLIESDLLLDFIDSTAIRIFNTGDFSLVDLSHQDNCWLDNYNESDSYHDRTIPFGEIISCYAQK